jgi:hypothetical protein
MLAKNSEGVILWTIIQVILIPFQKGYLDSVPSIMELTNELHLS